MSTIGVDTLTSIVRHHIVPQITDNAYLKNNALLYRLIRSGKRMIQGGEHIEVPLMHRKFQGGGSYRGFDLLNVVPQDTIKNGYLDWKQLYHGFAVDGLTLIKADSPQAIANLLHLQGQQLQMDMAELLAAQIFADGSNPKDLDGLGAIIGTSNTYAGIDRTTDTWWQSTVDASTNTLTLQSMRGLFSQATLGGTHPTIWFGNGTNYNRLYALNLSTSGYGVQYVRQPGGHDEVLAQAGFTNLLVENVPFVRDDNLPDKRILALNEDFLQLVVSPRADFYLEPFQKPVNQDAYVTQLLWAGNLMSMHSGAHAAFTELTA